MRTKDKYTREHRKVLQLAREYTRKGYEVSCEVPLGKNKLRADLVARKGNETIVIEVKTSDSLRAEKGEISQLAKYVATSIPGARFDLVLTNPRDKVATKR